MCLLCCLLAAARHSKVIASIKLNVSVIVIATIGISCVAVEQGSPCMASFEEHEEEKEEKQEEEGDQIMVSASESASQKVLSLCLLDSCLMLYEGQEEEEQEEEEEEALESASEPVSQVLPSLFPLEQGAVCTSPSEEEVEEEEDDALASALEPVSQKPSSVSSGVLWGACSVLPTYTPIMDCM